MTILYPNTQSISKETVEYKTALPVVLRQGTGRGEIKEESQFVMNVSGQTTIFKGDSGSPIFAKDPVFGGLYIFGVVSNSPYTQTDSDVYQNYDGTYTEKVILEEKKNSDNTYQPFEAVFVPYYYKWIKDTIRNNSN